MISFTKVQCLLFSPIPWDIACFLCTLLITEVGKTTSDSMSNSTTICGYHVAVTWLSRGYLRDYCQAGFQAGYRSYYM